jgi:NHL repeat/FG-GAP-like repeat
LSVSLATWNCKYWFFIERKTAPSVYHTIMKTSFGISSRRILAGSLVLSLALVANATPAYTFSTLAGSPGLVGATNGSGAAARFSGPNGIAVDSSGNLYVSDYNNHLIRKVTPAGVVSTFAGTGSIGSADGTGTAASFYYPAGIAIDSGGNLYVADSENHTIREITPGGVVTTLAGLAGQAGATDDTGSLARFNNPLGVAVDGAGTIYVADTSNQTIRSITPAGVVSTIAGLALSPGSTNGAGTAARFKNPFGLAVDGSGNTYVADNGNHTIRKITGNIVTTLAGSAGNSGAVDGTGTAAKFNAPYDLTVDAVGNVYVADFNNDTIRFVTPAGVVTTLAGVAHDSGHTDGIGSGALFANPAALAFGGAHILYVADYSNDTIRAGRVASADFSADGKNDIILENTATGERGIWVMDGATVTNWIGLPTEPTAWRIVGTGDFNGDGETDIVWENTTTGEHGIWTMNGGSVVAWVGLPTVPTDWQIAGVGDFNNDGQKDILWQNTNTGERGIWIMNGTSVVNWWGLPTEPTAWRMVGAGDFNGDGQDDIVWENTTTGEHGIWEMNNGSVVAWVGLPTVPSAWRVAQTGDFTGDGQTDIVWQNAANGARGIWEMNGTAVTNWVALPTVSKVWRIAGPGNFTGYNPQSSIVWENTATGEHGMWIMNGATVTSWAGLPTVPTAWHAAGEGDFTGDGQTDIVWENTATGEHGIWVMDGVSVVNWLALPTTATAWRIAGTGDFNGDGQTDILWENTTTGEHGAWLMSGGVVMSWLGLPTEAAPWRVAGTGDFNGDGQTDILWENTTTGEHGLWLMNGGTFVEWVGLPTEPTVWHMAGTGDFNGDGQTDIVWQNSATGERGIWLMNGTDVVDWAALPTEPTDWRIVGAF